MNKSTLAVMEIDPRSNSSLKAPATPMSAPTDIAGPNPGNSSIVFCDDVTGLAAINDAGKELVICARSVPFCLAHWLAEMAPSRLPDFRLLVRPVDARRAIEAELDECGMPPGEKRAFFIDDITRLVAVFAGITRSDLVDVRLDRIDHDACWKFHKDAVETRLLTTYRGSTTEWIDPRHAEQALQEQTDYDGPLESLEQNDIAIFRGNSANAAVGIVHRSPPIEGTGAVRLLLCLNAPSIVSPEPWQPNGEVR